jgi:biotin carboxylase
MVAALQAIQAPPDPGAEQGYLMLALTTLKYFPGKSPQDQFADLKAKFSTQLDALFTGCAHLFPKKQFNELVALLGKFGALGASGGAAAPFLPLIQALP